ncbi:hypothetical protein SGPA1_40579 [Streptomyces misionensis JCM 4497]
MEPAGLARLRQHDRQGRQEVLVAAAQRRRRLRLRPQARHLSRSARPGRSRTAERRCGVAHPPRPPLLAVAG